MPETMRPEPFNERPAVKGLAGRAKDLKSRHLRDLFRDDESRGDRFHLEADDGQIHAEELGPGETRLIPVGRRHRYEAIERTELVEVSSPELDDVVRVEDDFGRQGTTAP